MLPLFNLTKLRRVRWKKFEPLSGHWHLAQPNNDKSVNNFAISLNWPSIVRFMIAAELGKKKLSFTQGIVQGKADWALSNYIDGKNRLRINKLGRI